MSSTNAAEEASSGRIQTGLAKAGKGVPDPACP